jgi:hypothetical protein
MSIHGINMENPHNFDRTMMSATTDIKRISIYSLLNVDQSMISDASNVNKIMAALPKSGQSMISDLPTDLEKNSEVGKESVASPTTNQALIPPHFTPTAGSRSIRAKKHRCSECVNLFTSKDGLNVHIRSVHRREKNRRCGRCGLAFFGTSRLNRHLRRKIPCQPAISTPGEITDNNSTTMDTSNFKMEMNFDSLGDLAMFGEATAPWPPLPLPEEYGFEMNQEYFDPETPIPIVAGSGNGPSTFFNDIDRDDQAPPSPYQYTFGNTQTQSQIQSQADLDLQLEYEGWLEEEIQVPPSSPSGIMDSLCQVDFEQLDLDALEGAGNESETEVEREGEETLQVHPEPRVINGKFECHVCKRAFIYRKSLHTHLNGGHTHHQCAVEGCTEAFRLESELMSHVLEIHYGMKKHKCLECTSSFFVEHNRDKHMKKNHRKISDSSVSMEMRSL